MRNISQQEIAAPNSLLPQAKTDKLQKKTYFTTKRITYIATLTAITLMLKILGSFIPIGNTMLPTFVYFGWMLSSIIMGSVGGGIVAFCTDTLGWLIASNGPYNPIITLANTLFAVIVGLCYKYLPLKNKTIRVCIGAIISLILCTLTINSLALYRMYGYYKSMRFFEYLIVYRALQPLFVAINLTCVIAMLPTANRLKFE